MQALVREVLAAWRQAERVASEHAPGTPEHRAAEVAVERLRLLYIDLVDGDALLDPAAVEALLAKFRLPHALVEA
jgi:hypothetical protein